MIFKKEKKGLHDGAKSKGLKEGEVSRVWKAGPEDAIINHGEI